MTQVISRLAPSPTGRLHLGNAFSFLLCWLYVRQRGGVLYLRLDDIDPQRSKESYADSIMRDLLWLGLDWDYDPVWQSSRHELYESALAELAAKDLTYPCFCSRHDLRRLANAPHIGDAGVPYPGTCSNLAASQQRRLMEEKAYSWRLRTPEEAIAFTDIIQGGQSFDKMSHGGDFPLKRSDGVWAYQLASAIDDADLGVNFILRGRDLLSSTPRQILLARLLGHKTPTWAHIPLLLDSQGERLAKRHKSLALEELRANGASPEELVGKLGKLADINPTGASARPLDLLNDFDVTKIPIHDMKIGL